MLRSGCALLGALTVGLCVVGCGGGSSSNGEPTASDLQISTAEDTSVQGTAAVSDPDNDALTIEIVTPPSKGDVSISAENPLAFTYTPRADSNGTDTFTYRARDGRDTSNLATVSVTTAPVNDAPKISKTLALDEDSSASTQLVVEVDGDDFVARIERGPDHGTLAMDGEIEGKFVYSPDPNFNGADSFQLEAEDAMGAVSSQTVAVTVRPVNDLPVALPDSVRTVQGHAARFEPLANDADLDGDALTVTIASPPAVGTATVNSDGSIQYAPTTSFVGNTSIEYEVHDSAGGSATATLSIAVGFTSAVIYLALDGIHFADGARDFRVSAALQPGEVIQAVSPAQGAPIVFYMTNLSTVGHLYRVDLREPGVALEIDQPMGFPGIQDFTIDLRGSKVAYAFGGRLKLVDFDDDPALVRDLGDGQRSIFMNPSGTRVFYEGQITQPSAASGALFFVDTSGASMPQQITQTLTSPDSTRGIRYLSRDQQHLYYFIETSSGISVMDANPDVFGSEYTVQLNLPLTWRGLTADESAYWYRDLGVREDYYLVRLANLGAVVNLTGGTPNGQIYAAAMTSDASAFYYTRSDNNGIYSKLYRVDTSSPAASVSIGGPPPATYFGISDVELANGNATLLYTTMDNVATSGVIPGASDVFIVDLNAPNSPALVKHFEGPALIDRYAPDDTFVVILGAEPGSVASQIHLLNMLDRTQLIHIAGTSPTIIPNF